MQDCTFCISHYFATKYCNSFKMLFQAVLNKFRPPSQYQILIYNGSLSCPVHVDRMEILTTVYILVCYEVLYYIGEK